MAFVSAGAAAAAGAGAAPSPLFDANAATSAAAASYAPASQKPSSRRLERRERASLALRARLERGGMVGGGRGVGGSK